MRTLLVFLFVGAASACSGANRDASRASSFAGADSPERVQLRATEQPTNDSGRREWRLVSGDGSDTAAFVASLALPSAAPDTAMPAIRATLRRVPTSNGSVFLRELARAFGAAAVPDTLTHTDSLAIEAGLLGTRLTHGPGSRVLAGEFTDSPPGEWLVVKLFLAEGNAEVFLALNPRTREAQLIAKDPEYASAVLREFARLF